MIPPQPHQPTRKELIASWKKTTALLEQARKELSKSHRKEFETRLKEYHEWLSHNELELALDQLEEIGMEAPLSNDFWKFLVAAAENMSLAARADRLRKNLSSK
jgi:hypothetical protein